METEILTRILNLLGANAADYFIFSMGMVVVFFVVMLYRKHKVLTDKYNQLDKLNLLHGYIIKDKLGITTVKVHRSGDYEIVQPLNGAE